ncbi:putative minor capsid protein [Oceanobacillus neutriphilus]|nr:putative minor capsid protein [Oceanobacillus neutriphilus]
MPKPPKDFCIDSFVYEEFVEENWNTGPVYKEPIKIEHCRIDRGAQYSQSTSGKQLLFNAVIFCYEGITTPLPAFKPESNIHFDGIDHKLTDVIPIYEAYDNVIFSYELEVV